MRLPQYRENFSPGPEFDAAEKVTSERSDALDRHTKVLFHSQPTTIAGVIALTRYVAGLGLGQVPDDVWWPQVFLGILADAIAEASAAQGPDVTHRNRRSKKWVNQRQNVK